MLHSDIRYRNQNEKVANKLAKYLLLKLYYSNSLLLLFLLKAHCLYSQGKHMNTTSYPANELDVCLYLTNIFNKSHLHGRPKCYTKLARSHTSSNTSAATLCHDREMHVRYMAMPQHTIPLLLNAQSRVHQPQGRSLGTRLECIRTGGWKKSVYKQRV